MLAVPAIIAQHAEEAAFLWLLRRDAVSAPHYSLADLAKLDGRVEGHLDGLRIAGAEGWQTCAESLNWEGAGEVFTAGVLAFESADQARISQVFDAALKQPLLVDALTSALGWLVVSQATSDVLPLLSSESAVLRRAGLASCAVQRQYPADALRRAVYDLDSDLQARAMKAVGELGRLDLVTQAGMGRSSKNPVVRFWSAWSMALLTGDRTAVADLRSAAEAGGPLQIKAIDMAVRRMPAPEAKAWLKQFAQRPESARQAAIGSGALGDPESIPWLIETMRILPLARRAGEAFTMITGVDLAYRDLERKPPADFQSGPTEDPKDENVEMDPDDNLPWPEPALVQKWWDKQGGAFQNGTRYLLGKPMTLDWLKTVLRDGRQRQRAAAALELAIREPGKPLFNVKAPGFRQVQLLGKPGPLIR